MELAKALAYGRDELDFVKMADYAQRTGNSAVRKRLGYLLEKLEIGPDTAVNNLCENLGSGYALLDTLGDRKGHYVQRWRVVVNTSENELLQWKER